MINENNCVTKALIYDTLETKYYGNRSYIFISKEWFGQFVEDFFSVIADTLESGNSIELHRFGSFKIKANKQVVGTNTVVFISSKEINDNAVDSSDEIITKQDLASLLVNYFFKTDENELRFARRALVESIVVLLDLIKDAFGNGKKVSISRIGTLYVATDECYSSKIHRTRMRTRALLEPSDELIKKVNVK